MTESAAALADLTRWLGIAVAVVGALVANPAATQHGSEVVRQRATAALHRARGVLARVIPALRRDASVHAGTATGTLTLSGEASAVARAYLGWGPDATADEKFKMLDDRTRALDKEVGDLFVLVNTTKQDLRDQLNTEVGRLSAEAAEIRADVASMQQETVETDATALPLIVVGVVLADASSGAARFQVWFWLLALVAAVAFAGWSAWRLVRTWRGRS